MRTRYAVGSAALLFAAILCGVFATSHAPANARTSTAAEATPAAATNAEPAPPAEPEPNLFQSPFPDRSCVGVPSNSQCCTWQVFKQGNGDRRWDLNANYACDTGATQRGELRMRVTLNSPGATCDPRADLIPNNSVLTARGELIRRPDGFGVFTGTFEIRNPAGSPIFSGCIETIDRVGTHRSCEQCNPISHYEGWMTGRGLGSLSSFSIRASIGARGQLPTTSGTTQPTAIDINGIYLKCP